MMVIAVFLLVFIVPTIYGAYRAFSTGRTGWGVAILVAWVVGLGWLVGIVFLLGPDRQVRQLR